MNSYLVVYYFVPFILFPMSLSGVHIKVNMYDVL